VGEGWIRELERDTQKKIKKYARSVNPDQG